MPKKMRKYHVLHIVSSLEGGKNLELLLKAWTKQGAADGVTHSLISLTEAKSAERKKLKDYAISFIETFDPVEIRLEMEAADIVEICWERAPALDSFLRAHLPLSRLTALFWFDDHQSLGELQPSDLEIFDAAVVTERALEECTPLTALGTETKNERVTAIPGPSGEPRAITKKLTQHYERLVSAPKKIRFWGIDMMQPLLAQEVVIEDLMLEKSARHA